MNEMQIDDPKEIAEIERNITPTRLVAGPTQVIIGDHPEHGHVILIKTSGGDALLCSDGVRVID